MSQSEVKYKLTYFDIRGRGEVSRILFSYAGVPFEDVRLSFEEWPSLKSKSPFGKLPNLEVNGRTLNQSCAIERYLATKFNLIPSTAEDQADADSYVAEVEDFLTLCIDAWYAKEEGDKQRTVQKATDSASGHLTVFEKRLKDHKFLVGDKLSWADIHLMFWYTSVYVTTVIPTEILEKFPSVKKHHDSIASIPEIKAYLDKRPPES